MTKHRLAPNFDTPLFCPCCEEIRGVDFDTGATCLNTTHESLIFHSFGMCQACLSMTREHPEQVEINKQVYRKKREEQEARIKAEIQARRFRVWFFDTNEKVNNSKFVSHLTGKPFFTFGVDHESELGKGFAFKCKELVSLEDAQTMRDLILSKDIPAWFEEEVKKQLTTESRLSIL